MVDAYGLPRSLKTDVRFCARVPELLPTVHPLRGWLPGLLPVDTHRIRAEEPALVAMLRDAGADIVDSEPQVEIADVTRLSGDADRAIAILSPEPVNANLRVVRGVE